MSDTCKRIGFFVLGAALATVTAAAVHAAGQSSGPGPASFIAQQGGPGGPDGGPGPRGRGPGRGMGRGGPMGPGGPGGPVDLPLGRLGLSPQQQDQVQTIIQSHDADMRALGQRGMTLRDALEAAISADTVDDYLIRTRAADVAAIDAEMAVSRAHIRAEVFQVLTAEQQALAKQLQAQMEQQRAQMQAQRGARAGSAGK